VELNALPPSCPRPPPGVAFNRPHTMATADMAHFLSALDGAMGRDTFSPAAVVKAVQSFRGWDGSKPHVRWKGILLWHTHCCERGACIPAGFWKASVERCVTLRVLLWVATVGIQPSLWWVEPPRQELAVRKPYYLTPEEEDQARRKHDAFRASGVLQEVSKRLSARDKRLRGVCLASAFTVVQHKAIESDAARRARDEWVGEDPPAVTRFISGDKAARPPAAAFKSKWRVVYDFKALNTATIKLPMAYGMQDEAFSKVQPGDTLMALDVQDGFTALPVAAHERCWFTSVAQGQSPTVAARMPFGYRLAPYFFCLLSGMAANAVQVMLGDAGSAHMYMDDLMVALRKTGAVMAQKWLTRCRSLLLQCGLHISSEKIEGPARAITYLGLRVAALPSRVEVCMPQHKWFTLSELFRMLAAMREASEDRRSLTRGAIDSLVGKLGALATFLPLSKPDLAILYKMKWWSNHPGAKRTRTIPVSLTADQLAAALRLQQQIAERPSATVRGDITAHAGIVVFGAVDASGEGGIGGHVRSAGEEGQRCWSLRVAGAEAGDEWVGLSTILEIRAILEAVRQTRSLMGQRKEGVRLQLAGDSQAAIALARRGYSTRCGTTNDLCRALEKECTEGVIQLSMVWVPRAANWRADHLSHPGHTAESWQNDLPSHVAELAPRR